MVNLKMVVILVLLLVTSGCRNSQSEEKTMIDDDDAFITHEREEERKAKRIRAEKDGFEIIDESQDAGKSWIGERDWSNRDDD